MFFKSLLHSLQEFEDLDEITARYIQPMASFARDLLGHKYFQECNGGNKEVCTDLLLLPVFCLQVVPLTPYACFHLVLSLIENGGVIGQNKEGKANFYSLLYFGL